MGRSYLAAAIAAGTLLTAVPSFAQNAGQGRAIVTVFAKHTEVAPIIAQSDVSARVNGKDSTVTGWTQFKGADDGLELVILIDGAANNLGRQFDEIKQFVDSLGPHTKIAVGYMENGRAVISGPLTSDHKQALSGLHLPGGPHTNPYFSLSDLAQNWPSRDLKVRREVILLSDGIDLNNQRFDPEDPYVQSAIRDSVRAGLVVYPIYWRSRPENDLASNGGESLMNEVAEATGGYNYSSGLQNPVSFQPFFTDLVRRFANQYALEFTARLDRKPAVEPMKLKIEGLGLQVTAPQQVFVTQGGQQE
jgi:hypothetical protein